MKPPPPSRPIESWLSKPVIPVFWQPSQDDYLLADASILFLQGGELAELEATLARLRQGPTAKTPIMLHIDLLAGLTSDEAGLRFLAGLKGIDGIITVRAHMVTQARRFGLASVLLLFLQDGRSVERGLHVIEQSKPDMVELVPGAAALETAEVFERVAAPRIAGGLVRTQSMVRRLLDRGCAAVSTSDSKLWGLNRTRTAP